MRLALSDPRIVITAACPIAFVNFGSRTRFGVFREPISATHGGSREIVAVSISIQRMLWGGLCQPVAGAVANRYVTRRVLIVGALIYAARAVVIALNVTLPISETLNLIRAAGMGLLWLSIVSQTLGWSR